MFKYILFISVCVLCSCSSDEQKRGRLRAFSLDFYLDINREASRKNDAHFLTLREIRLLFSQSRFKDRAELYVLRSSRKGEGVMCGELGSFLVENESLGFSFFHGNENSGEYIDEIIDLEKWEHVSTKHSE
jgi:hypothetical protein